ncbi:hypothetical protein LCGC14_1019750 [marine sediment metagenome]|uniref:Radical SAM core domain-containing protein n=1 Tax=marine sediment metagenome TaxID=412755 RepID=A0A0F9N2A9_9ZZZZ
MSEWWKNPDNETMGRTVSPITGCLGGCGYCFARQTAEGRCRHTYLANNILPTHDEPDHAAHHQDPFYPRFWPSRLEEIRRRKLPTGYFVSIMGEMFGPWVPREWQDQVMDTIRACPQHRFYLLTKYPELMIPFSPFPDNCRVGFTADTCGRFREEWGYFMKVKAPVKFISFEPLLTDMAVRLDVIFEYTGIRQVIIGPQTKPTRQPDIEWVRTIVQAADAVGVAVFLKDKLGWPRLTADGAIPFYKRVPSGTMELRQELPAPTDQNSIRDIAPVPKVAGVETDGVSK